MREVWRLPCRAQPGYHCPKRTITSSSAGGRGVKLPGLGAYYDFLAAERVTYLARRREDRERQREHEANGPVFRYVPYGGIYMMMNESGSFMGYVDRDESGEWVSAEVRPLLATT